MFGRKKKLNARDAAGEFAANFIDHHDEIERMKGAARASERPIAILKPQIPIGAGPAAGWFGGDAELPEGVVWPEKDGQQLLFVGQINLSALPKGIWSDVGPRQGWLGFFLPEKGELKPTVLHFDGPLFKANGPLPNSADWTNNHNFKEPKTFALPRWPIVIGSRSGNELHLLDVSQAEEKQPPKTLLDPAYHPFDRDTVALFLKTLGENVTRLAQQAIRFPIMKKLRPEDAERFENHKATILQTFVKFFEVEGRMRAEHEINVKEIADCIAELSQLDAYDCQYIRNDDEGFCELDLRPAKLLDLQPDLSDLGRWWYKYDMGLTNHAINAYTTEPSSLPLALRERLEAQWKRQTVAGLGAMGHAPLGHIYSPHGPDSPNEVLLELHTSQITGWIWGDCYSLVLLIERDALRRGDFSSIAFDITN